MNLLGHPFGWIPMVGIPTAIAISLATPTAAHATKLTFAGQVHVDQANPEPLPRTRITVTFHGHEAGIHEYTTERSTSTLTAADGSFYVEVKLSEYRYRWTHVTISIPATDISKGITTLGLCTTEDGQGCQGAKDIWVTPLPLLDTLGTATAPPGNPHHNQ